MYRKPTKQLKVEDFVLPFEGYLSKNNRWVQLASMIPWDVIEEKYATLFAEIGTEAKPARVALGALIIKEKLGITDRETVDQIRENPICNISSVTKNTGMSHPLTTPLWSTFANASAWNPCKISMR
jgi:hypothetical protein